jgi:Cu(I)/Ag(I) efflux system protein CusF
MKTFKNATLAALFATATLASTSLLAQPTMDMNRMNGMKGGGMAMEMDAKGGAMTNGEVKKIDKETQKITLKHGPIQSMEMPGMTMVFKVMDASLLDTVKVGDRVKFNVEKRQGAMVVTAIEIAK